MAFRQSREEDERAATIGARMLPGFAPAPSFASITVAPIPQSFEFFAEIKFRNL
jgi:hypothetical protein